MILMIMARTSNFCVLTDWSELPLMSGTKISFCKFNLLRLSQLTWAKSHFLLRDEFIQRYDWPRGKGWLPLPTVHIPAGSPSERKKGSGCTLSISSLCFLTSATRPRFQTLLQRSVVWSSDIAVTHFRQLQGFSDKFLWPLNSISPNKQKQK